MLFFLHRLEIFLSLAQHSKTESLLNRLKCEAICQEDGLNRFDSFIFMISKWKRSKDATTKVLRFVD